MRRLNHNKVKEVDEVEVEIFGENDDNSKARLIFFQFLACLMIVAALFVVCLNKGDVELAWQKTSDVIQENFQRFKSISQQLLSSAGDNLHSSFELCSKIAQNTLETAQVYTNSAASSVASGLTELKTQVISVKDQGSEMASEALSYLRQQTGL